MKTIEKQSTSALTWKDETGTEVQMKRITATEKQREALSHKLLKQALEINVRLVKFKEEVNEICSKVYASFMEERNNEKAMKGNFTWFNFNRSIRVMVKINEQIIIDELHAESCKSKLLQFLNSNVTSESDMIKQMVLDAFETSRGKLDVKKVLKLLSYKSKIKDTQFQSAMTDLEDGIRKAGSKTYFQIAYRAENGEYENVELNFSAI